MMCSAASFHDGILAFASLPLSFMKITVVRSPSDVGDRAVDDLNEAQG